MNREPLTIKQQLVFDYVCACLDDESLPPSYAEIQEHMKYKSINAVTEMLERIEKKGWIKLIRGKSRGIIPTTATIISGNCRKFQFPQ